MTTIGAWIDEGISDVKIEKSGLFVELRGRDRRELGWKGTLWVALAAPSPKSSSEQSLPAVFT